MKVVDLVVTDECCCRSRGSTTRPSLTSTQPLAYSTMRLMSDLLTHMIQTVKLTPNHDQGELERKAHETLQFLHDMRPDKAGQKAVRPAVPESRAQRLLLGKLASKIALLWQLRLSEGFAIPAGQVKTMKEWSKAISTFGSKLSWL